MEDASWEPRRKAICEMYNEVLKMLVTKRGDAERKRDQKNSATLREALKWRWKENDWLVSVLQVGI